MAEPWHVDCYLAPPVTPEQILRWLERRANRYEEDARRLSDGREPLTTYEPISSMQLTIDRWLAISGALKDMVAHLRLKGAE